MEKIYLMVISSLLFNCGPVLQAQEAQKPLPSDNALSEKIGGIWPFEGDLLNGNAHRSARINLATNSQYTIEVKDRMTERPAKGEESIRASLGTWLVKDGCLVMTKLKMRSGDGDIQSMSKPEVSTNRIVRATDKQLVFIYELTGREQAWNRGN
ncbi:MAG TPA: hypothetical protein VMA35_07900 [Candidatus Sulfopaludibacter sp.]|nr:hypothetical protein [Candidatus Sulfopaludibacter sp.]